MNGIESNAPWESGMLASREGSPYLYNGERLFFWLGDTAWLIFHKLRREEIKCYLRNRAEKGFNVIQMVLVHHLPAVNAYGRNAFLSGNLDQPDTEGADSYWGLVDETIAEAKRLGMYCALLPHWGSLAERITGAEMEGYIRFLAKRYCDRKNIIWVTGGDVRGTEKEAYWRTMGSLLKEACGNHLVTFHPFGRTSSINYFPNEPWMDFHMFQSGHRRYDQVTLGEWDDNRVDQNDKEPFYGEDNWRYVRDAEALVRRLPILDAEPAYEHIPQGLHPADQPYWEKEQIRRYAWWSVLSGACGFTYGHNSIMQFYEGNKAGAFHVKLTWQDALHAPGCDAMVHMKRLMELVLARGGRQTSCAEWVLSKECGWKANEKEERIVAYRAGNCVVFYTYTGRTIGIDCGRLAKLLQADQNKQLEAWWMYPESGIRSYAGTHSLLGEGIRFCPPAGDETHKDWLLIVEVTEG